MKYLILVISLFGCMHPRSLENRFDCDEKAISENVRKWKDVQKVCDSDILDVYGISNKEADNDKCYLIIENITSHVRVVPADLECQERNRK